MSISFYPATKDGAVVRPLLRCACAIREEFGLDKPGEGTCAACDATLNLNDRNGRDLLDYLGLPADPHAVALGDIDAGQLIELCRTRLAMVEAESEIPARQIGRVFEGGRPASRLRERCTELLEVATLARGFRVAWS